MRLQHMYEAGLAAMSFVQGVSRSDFDSDQMRAFAVVRALEIIGEAANHLSPQFRKKHSEISWAVFVRFRNILAHEYGDSLINRVWLASTESAPELLKALDKLLVEKPEE